jgi:hypothetical protein
MEKNALKPKEIFLSRHSGMTMIVLCLLTFGLSSCHWKVKPTFPGDRIAESMRQLCSRDYKLSVETRHADGTLQTVVWKVGLFSGHAYDLQGMRKEAADTMEHVFLCATRVALSTDAPLQFIEVKMADVLTGTTITLWRYVPDIRDSMYERIGDTEYFNRLVVEIDSDNKQGFKKSGMDWDKPITLGEFLAKQIISRVRREGGESLQAHADLSDPATLGVVIDNWPAIEEEGPDHVAKVTDSFHKSAQSVIKGYQFHGFHGVIVRDSEGVAVGSWTL